MADDTVKRLLVKLGISTTEWKQAVREIQSKLSDVNEKAKRDAKEMQAAQKVQIDLTKQQIAEQKRLSAEAKALADFDKAKAAWQSQQQAALKTKLAQRVLETAEVKKQSVQQLASLNLEKEQLRVIQQRLKVEQQLRNEQLRQTKAQSSGGGGIFGTIGALTSGLAGGGLLGSVAGGAAVGTIISEGAVKLIELASEKMHSLGAALVEATGPAVQLREQFEKLTLRAGIGPDEYLNKLRAATRGLVEDTSLYRIANNFMQQGLKVSEDEIVRMIKATVDLARAQGKDATVATQALERASKTGRMQVLAMVTGLTRQELALRGVSNALDATTRNTIQFNQVLTAMESRERAIGTPLTTLPELFKQWQTVQKNLTDDMSFAITQSSGFKTEIQVLSNAIVELQPKLSELVIWIGKRVGDALQVAVNGTRLLVSVSRLLEAELETWAKVASAITGIGTSIDGVQEKGSAFKNFVADISYGLLTMAEYANRAAIRMSALGDITSAVAKGDFTQVELIVNKMKNDLESSRQEYLGNVNKINEFRLGVEPGIQAAHNQGPPPPSIAGEKQRQKLELEITKETAKIKLDITMEYLKRTIDATKAAYEANKSTLQQEVNDLRELYTQEHLAKLKQIKDDNDAQIKNIRQTGAETNTPKDIIQKQVTVQNQKSFDERLKEETQYNERNFQLDQQLLKDKEAAEQAHIQHVTALEKQGVVDRMQLLEKEFAQGRVQADDYLNRRRAMVVAEYLAVKNGEEQKKAQTIKEQQAITDAVEKAKLDRDNKLRQLDESADDTRLKAEENYYNRRKAMLAAEASAGRFGKSTGQQGATDTLANQELLVVTQQHIQNLMTQETALGRITDQNAETWIKIRTEIEKSVLEVDQLKQKIAQARDISAPIGGIAGALGGVFGAIPGRTTTGISRVLGNIQSSSADISRFSTNAGTAGGGVDFVKQLGGSFTDLFKKEVKKGVTDDNGNPVLDQFGKQLQKIVKIPFADKLESFSKGLEGAASGLQGLIKGVTGGTSGGSGALSGGMAGMQFGANFGPIGAAAGAVGGAVMGGIFGAKEKQLQQDIHKIQTEMQSIVDSMNAGTISMSQAIQDMRQERQAAIAMLAQDPKGSKGGGKGGKKGNYNLTQAQSVIQQIDQQISQLVDQQTTILQNLHQSLIELSQPIAFQSYLSSLDQIIQKYQQFASAASGNAQEVANANLYLNDSLQQYVTTLSQQLNQAQQQAIQDALTLINLEYQRQQIINQEAQQEYDVLTAGVLTRQRTTAMTKGQEIGQLRYQRDMQLEQINEQIALEQYKVNQETQIFGLATTRIGLEYQLLAAQESAAGVQVQQIQALSQVVSLLGSGLTSGQLMSQITSQYANGQLPTGTGILATIASLLGLGGNIPTSVTSGQYGSVNWLAQIPQPYQSAASYMSAMDPNFYTMFEAAIATAANSVQRVAAAADVGAFSSQGTAEGYNMGGLANWLLTGSTTSPGTGSTGGGGGGGRGPNGDNQYSPIPQYAVGAFPVPQTGPAIVHEGEWILPKPIVGLINAFKGKYNTPIAMPIGGGVGTTTMHLQIEKNISTLAQQRASMEMQVVSAKTSLLNGEMAYLQALNTTLASINSLPASSGSGTSFEGLLQKVYEVRGRFGSAGFRRETI